MRMKLRTVLSNLIQQQYFRHSFRLVGEVCDIFEDQRVCQVPADKNVICQMEDIGNTKQGLNCDEDEGDNVW